MLKEAPESIKGGRLEDEGDMLNLKALITVMGLPLTVCRSVGEGVVT